MTKKGILITGGTGLVGAYATGMLLERGERPVIFASISTTASRSCAPSRRSLTLERGLTCARSAISFSFQPAA